MMERERRSEGQQGGDGAEAQEASPHVLRQLMTRAGQGDAAAAHKLSQLRKRRAQSRAQADGSGAMDPSVAALFRGEQSSDQEMGTGAHDVAQQADSMRLALQKHLSEFDNAVASATKIVIAGLAGYGKVKHTPDVTERISKLASMAVSLAWQHCGGGAEISAVLKIAKAEVLGHYKGYADKAYEFVKGQIEKHGGAEISLDEISKAIATTVTLNSHAFVERGKQAIVRAPATELAKSWRLISGTRENATTTDGGKLDGEQKETVTTEMLESLTGINVSGGFAVQLAATIMQNAQADLAQLIGPEGRSKAIADTLHSDVGGRVERIAHETGEDAWMRDDADKRARAHQ
jgi:hypothetical protein